MWPFNFHLTDNDVQVRLGRWVLRRVRLDDIESVGTASLVRVPFWNEHWCNFSPMRYVILRRKSGWVRSFVINPPDTEPFAIEVRRKIA